MPKPESEQGRNRLRIRPRVSNFVETLIDSVRSMKRLLALTRTFRPQYVVGMLLSASRGMIQTVAFSLGIYWILDAALTYGAERAAATGYRVLFLSMLLVGAYAAGTYLLDAAVIRTSDVYAYGVLRQLFGQRQYGGFHRG